MTRKLALKKLKSSDLSFFEAYFRRFPQTKQKSLNLDRRIIESEFFPSLTEVVDALPDQRALVALTIFGPGLAAPHHLARKILKQEKNWRLNGELVHNPEDAPKRYDVLTPGDFALMEFRGSGAPSGVKMVLICKDVAEDVALHRIITRDYPAQSMQVLADADIRRITMAAEPVVDHPIWDWLDKDLIEEVGQGGSRAAQKLNRRRRGRGISLADLQASKANAEHIGLLGEELLNHLLATNPPPEVIGHEWVAQTNAISPFDFKLECEEGRIRFADAKSTSGRFGNPLHLSLAEIDCAIESAEPYDLYRLYEVRDGFARCRIARGIREQLKAISDILAHLPEGVDADSLSFNPDFFGFNEDVIDIQIDEDDEEGDIG